MSVSEICETCGGIKGAPDHVSLTQFCDCPAFPPPKEFDLFEYEDPDDLPPADPS